MSGTARIDAAAVPAAPVVAGPGRVRKWSPGQQAMLAAAFGYTGALVAYGSTRIKTFVRVQTTDSELFFLHTAF